MSKLRGCTVSEGIARCRGCGEIAVQTVRETRYVRAWHELLDRHFDPAVARTASCAACGLTYPVRSTDRTVEGAGRRGVHAAGRVRIAR